MMTPWLMKALRKPFLHNASVRYLNEFLTRAKRLKHTTNGFVLYRLDDVDIFTGMSHSFTQLQCSKVMHGIAHIPVCSIHAWHCTHTCMFNTCITLHTYMYVHSQPRGQVGPSSISTRYFAILYAQIDIVSL